MWDAPLCLQLSYLGGVAGGGGGGQVRNSLPAVVTASRRTASLPWVLKSWTDAAYVSLTQAGASKPGAKRFLSDVLPWPLRVLADVRAVWYWAVSNDDAAAGGLAHLDTAHLTCDH